MTEIDDLIARLEEGKNPGSDLRWTVTPLHREAATALRSAHAEIARLTAALADKDAATAAYDKLHAMWESLQTQIGEKWDCIECPHAAALAQREAECARLRAERDVARRAIVDDALDAFDMLTLLRGAGWRVAVHNDYRQHGQEWTFWLLTHPNGRWIKGEGVSDALALDQAMRNSRALSPIPADPEGAGR